MWPGEAPGRVERRSADAVRRRWRSAAPWLRVMVGWCHGAAALAVVAVVLQWLRLGPEWAMDDPRPTAYQWGGAADNSSVFGQVLILALAIAPLVIASWVAKRDVDGVDWRLKPDEWIYYGLFVGLCEAPPLLYAINSFVRDGLPTAFWPVALVLACAIPLGAGYAARRAILARPLREIGGSEFVLTLGLRSRGKGGDSVKLTAERLKLSAVNAAGGRPGGSATKDVELRAITEIGVRQSSPDDAAWAWLSDGRGASLPAGEVVVVRTRDDEQLLPADAEIAELLRARVALHGREPARINFDDR